MLRLFHVLIGHNFKIIYRTEQVLYYRCSCGLLGIWTDYSKCIFYGSPPDGKFKFEGKYRL